MRYCKVKNMTVIIDDEKKRLIEHGFLDDLPKHTRAKYSLWAVCDKVDFSVLEEEILPRFERINIIFTGKESPEFASLEMIKSWQKELSSLKEDSPLRKRVLDGDITIKYLLRPSETEFFLIEGTNDWRAYVGSKDVLMRRSGTTSENFLVYENYFAKMNRLSYRYLDAKILQKYESLNEEDQEDFLLKGSHLADIITSQQAASFKGLVSSSQLSHNAYLRKIKVASRLLKIKKASDAKKYGAGSELLADGDLTEKMKQLAFTDLNVEAPIVVPDEEKYYPKPFYSQNPQTGEIIKRPEVDSYQKEDVEIKKPTRQDVSAIFDIARFYRARKQDNESQATFSFLMYVLESGSIWKIRQAIDKRNGIVEDVPIVVGLIGQGETGKSTLLKIASNLTIGNTQSIIQASSEDKLFGMTAGVRKKLLSGKSLTKQDRAGAYSSNPKVINKNIWNFTDRYMDVGSSITPICIDDPEVSLFSSAAAQSFLKKRSNRHGDQLKIEPTAIFSMNSKGKDLELLAEVGRRGYVISQGNQFRKKTDADVHFFEYLDGNTDNHGHRLNNTLYLYLTKQIEKWLDNMTDDDYLHLKRDFLYPVKVEFWKLVEEYDLVNTETKYYISMDNYNLADDLGRRNWSILLHDEAVLREMTFTRDNPECVIPSRAFPNKGNDIRRYFGYIPQAAEICKTYDSQGLTLNIENMDRWQGNHLLTDWYEQVTGIAQERFEMEKAKAAAEVQGQKVGQNIAPLLQKNNEIMDQMMEVTKKNAQLLAEKDEINAQKAKDDEERLKQADEIQRLQTELEEEKAKKQQKRGFFSHFFNN